MQIAKASIVAALIVVAATATSSAQGAENTPPAGGAAAGQPAPEPEKKSEPFAFADFTWLTGNPRTKDSPLEYEGRSPASSAPTPTTPTASTSRRTTRSRGSSEVFRSASSR